MKVFWTKLVLLFLCTRAVSGEVALNTATTNDLPRLEENFPLKKIAEGVFEIGKVRLDKNLKTISFPATINMDKGAVEYLLVNNVGKLHESVLRTEVEPIYIHLAALLLSVKGAGTNLTVQDFDTKDIPGERVTLWVTWKTNQMETKLRAERLVFNSQKKLVMKDGAWVYNGSQTIDGTFIVQRDGSIISLISDPLALINNPRPGRENDELWQVNTNLVPQLNTPVEFVIQLETKAKK